MRLTELRPMLACRDLDATKAFYEDKLGFKCVGEFEHGGKAVWREFVRDEVAIMCNMPPASAFEEGNPGDKRFQVYYINSDDVVALHADLTRRGAPVTDLRVTVYGMKEFEARDPDGHWLWFGQPTDEAPTVRE
ncbi:MAG: VOC family protein [Phycisphaerales bacterium]